MYLELIQRANSILTVCTNLNVLVKNLTTLFPQLVLGLFCELVSHMEAHSKKVFSQHNYLDLEDVIVKALQSNRNAALSTITLVYKNDKPYTFIVSDEDMEELLLLLKGRLVMFSKYQIQQAVKKVLTLF